MSQPTTTVAGVGFSYKAGDEVGVISAGVKHTVWNEGDEGVHALGKFRPASVRFETI